MSEDSKSLKYNEPEESIESATTAIRKKIAYDDNSTLLSRVILILLTVMMIFSVLAYGAVDVGMIGVNSILAGLIAIFWLMDAWKSGRFVFNKNYLQIPLIGLLVIGLIQLLPLGNSAAASDILSIPVVGSLSLNPYLTRLFLIQLLIAFVFFAASLTYINNRKRYQSIALMIIIFSSIMAFFGILQYLANPEAIYGLRLPRQSSPFASFFNKHHFAAFMEMTLGLTLALLFGSATRDNKKIFLIIAAVIMGLALVLTGSRGGMIGFLSVLGFVILTNYFLNRIIKNKNAGEDLKKVVLRRNLILFGGGFVLILVLLFSVILVGGDQSLMRGIGLTTIEGDISTGRIHFWGIALQIFLDHPIIGAGFDAYGVAFTQYDSWSGAFRVEQAHNDYLQILADSGILGFSCIAVFIYLLFKQGFYTIRKDSDKFVVNGAVGALAGCVGILIHSFFDFPLRTYSNTLFFLMLVTLAVVPVNFQPVRRKKVKVIDDLI